MKLYIEKKDLGLYTNNIRFEYYSTPNIKHNWRVYLDHNHIGDMHDCDGIGGYIGRYTDTILFDWVSQMLQYELDGIIA